MEKLTIEIKNADLNVRERKEIPSIFCCFKFEKANFHKLKEKMQTKEMSLFQESVA